MIPVNASLLLPIATHALHIYIHTYLRTYILLSRQYLTYVSMEALLVWLGVMVEAYIRVHALGGDFVNVVKDQTKQ